MNNSPASLLDKPTKPKKVIKPKALKLCNVANKPILEPHVEEQIHAVIMQFHGSQQWYAWGMKHYRKQGPLVIFEGPPGTGKTLSASYLTQLIKRPLAVLDLGKFGSATPGEGERNIEKFFADAMDHSATVFIDEADGVLWDRSNAGPTSMWMISIINKLLTELSNYRHLSILASNHSHQLDGALLSRAIAVIEIARPSFETRFRLWQNKIPKQYPLQLSVVQCNVLAQYDLTGRTIENAVVKEAQLAILQGREPDFDSLCNVAKSFQGL